MKSRVRVGGPEADGVSGQGLHDDGGDDGSGRLARAVSIERPNDGHRQVVGVMKAKGEGVRTDLGRRVRRLGLKGVILRDGNLAGRSIDLAA